MTPANEKRTIFLDLTEDQFRYLENAKQFLENETGCQVTHATILNRILEKGLPHFEEELRRVRVKGSKQAKRFPKIHLAYSADEA